MKYILTNQKKKLGKQIIVYIKKMCKLIDNCWIVTATDECFIIEIDIQGNNLVAEGICKKLLTKCVHARRVEKKLDTVIRLEIYLLHFRYSNNGVGKSWEIRIFSFQKSILLCPKFSIYL